MARNIDFDNLSKDDIQYLRQRDALVREAELLGYTDIRKTVDADMDAQPEYDAEQDVDPSPQSQGNADLPATEEIPPYSEWSKDELVAELKTRKLSASGNKDELVARLDADDEEEEEPEEEEEA